jgi:DNA-binding response OmpR family regulator
MKLLVVDDEPHVREMMRLTLEAAGYEIDEAGSGEAALGSFGDGRTYDAVLLDQKMPGLDGLETMKRLLAVAPDKPVIMVTAFASIELAVDAMRLGAANFLRKPMTPETLRGSVAAALTGAPGRPRVRSAAAAPSGIASIQTVTLNGFRIDYSPQKSSATPNEHVFSVTRFPDGASQTVTITVDPEAVARVARLTRRDLTASGAFWRSQAERLLSGHLWTEGRFPEGGRLTLRDVTREDLDVAAAWTAD